MTTMRNRGFSVAYGEQPENSDDIKLLPSGAFAQYSNEYTGLTNLPNGASVLLQDLIPVAQNFFYTIESYDCMSFKRKLIAMERGVGELYEKDDSFYLKREFIKSFNDGFSEYPTKNSSPFNFSNHKNLIVKSYIPSHYLDIFIYPYSVLCSIEAGIPTPVELQEKSVVGRLNDTIQSIDKDELREIITDENIVDAVQENKTLELESITLKPSSRPRNPKKGTIIFNKRGYFEGYDGEEWIILE